MLRDLNSPTSWSYISAAAYLVPRQTNQPTDQPTNQLDDQLFHNDKLTHTKFVCLWFRSSLTYINKCPTRCNTSSLFIILQVHSTCFGCQLHPSSGVHKTVSIASGNGHILCTPDDGCGWHPKHVEWTCRIINRLLCVASRWTIINTKFLLVQRS